MLSACGRQLLSSQINAHITGASAGIEPATLRLRQRALMLSFPFHEVFDLAVDARSPGTQTCTFPLHQLPTISTPAEEARRMSSR